MRAIDFLSESPPIFIFKDKANHTNWGGIFSLIYFILIIFIIIFYIIDFTLSDTYEIEYTFFDNFMTADSSKSSLIDIDEEYFPNLDFSFEIYDDKMRPLNDSFILIDGRNDKPIQRNYTWIRINVSALHIAVFMKCEGDEQCASGNYTEENYYIGMRHSGFILDHQNDSKPIYIDNKKYIQRYFKFSFNHAKIFELNWDIIKYKKDKGISLLIEKLQNKKDEYIGGSLEYYDSYSLTKTINMVLPNERYRLLTSLEFNDLGDKIVIYKRSKKQIFDLLASIGALCSTFFSIFSKVFHFYSNSFDNYKIVEHLFIKRNINKNNKEEAINNLDMVDGLFNSSSEINNLNKNEEKIIINDNYDSIDDNSYKSNYSKLISKFPKFNILDFFFNNIYYKKCCRPSIRQEIISICNEIIANYFSIDHMLFNNILISNLLEDYKWNDPKLNNPENNSLLIKLKKSLENYIN